jgi:hypothetical protein
VAGDRRRDRGRRRRSVDRQRWWELRHATERSRARTTGTESCGLGFADTSSDGIRDTSSDGIRDPIVDATALARCDALAGRAAPRRSGTTAVAQGQTEAEA